MEQEQWVEHKFPVQLSKFKDGSENITDAKRSSHPTPSRTHPQVEKITDIVTCWLIIWGRQRKKWTWRVCIKVVPTYFSGEQKNIFSHLSARKLEEPDLAENTVTNDETWVFQLWPRNKMTKSSMENSSLWDKKKWISNSRFLLLLSKKLSITFFLKVKHSSIKFWNAYANVSLKDAKYLARHVDFVSQ